MKKLILLLFVITFFLVSCRTEEKVINNYTEIWNVLAATDSDTPSLMLVELPEGKIINNDVFLSANGEQLSGKVTKMVLYRDKIYLLIPSKYKIEVINKLNYQHIATIDFTSTQREPSDICFPNATSAYVAHGNDTVVSLVDISDSVFKVARTIKVGIHPVAIANSGMRIYVANQKSNTISVIDGIHNIVEKVIPVHTAPGYIGMNSDRTKALVLSLGGGKIDSSAKTAAKITVINKEDNSIIRTVEIGSETYKSINQVPSGIVITDYDRAYILCQDNIFTMDVNFGESVIESITGTYNNPFFDLTRLQLILLKNNNPGKELYVINPDNEAVKNNYTFSTDVICILPL
ncbi:MAG: hypothetical protein HZB41_12505 [Ignavibacteriae bacterium]|nr:hypothetical protein [Ignavibacteriota bacterium]